MASYRILLTGAHGFLGPYAYAALCRAGHRVIATARAGSDADCDLLQPAAVDRLLAAVQPDLVLQLAAMARLSDCAANPAMAHATNVAMPQRFAQRLGGRLLQVSTDLVFDGRGAPYGEHAMPAPLSVYGASKAEGELAVLQHGGRVVRLPLLFGPDARGRGATAALRQALASGQPVSLFTNEYRTPLHAADAAEGLAECLLLADGPRVLHLAGPERCSRWELGQRFCGLHGLPTELLQPVECQDVERPRDVTLVGSWQASRSLAAMLGDG